MVAVNALTGETRIFDRSSGAALVDAVAASCAIPGIWPAADRRRHPLHRRRRPDALTRTPSPRSATIRCPRPAGPAGQAGCAQGRTAARAVAALWTGP
ncbi:hypothetical protein [Streptomyces sp. NPDC005374]|uniref:hypothetical protein n=1 Tax=Streptomyces sp. NPDC005374 TaxID=3364713 RepID=UPI0036CF7C0E